LSRNIEDGNAWAGADAPTTLQVDGYEYRTVMPGVSPDSSSSFGVCHTSDMWLPIPDGGYELAPDTAAVRQRVVAAHSWSTDVM
jgi:hypothetical protein